jgi:thiamine biosynthesis protein ThiC
MPKEVEVMRCALKKDSETLVELSIGAHRDDVREEDLRECQRRLKR